MNKQFNLQTFTLESVSGPSLFLGKKRRCFDENGTSGAVDRAACGLGVETMFGIRRDQNAELKRDAQG
ncbi:MAG: hypothetical protein Q7K57_33410 [Burkholderiaceae bacterium]|nr:hypothetical protein [Burkholderiaceae bacterium]